jgi:hypothetical protein
MTQEPPRPLPASTVQAAGQAATDIIGGLKQNPALLAIVVLNVLAVAIGVWFLSKIADNAERQREHLFKILETCLQRQGQLAPSLPGIQRETLVEKQ